MSTKTSQPASSRLRDRLTSHELYPDDPNDFCLVQHLPIQSHLAFTQTKRCTDLVTKLASDDVGSISIQEDIVQSFKKAFDAWDGNFHQVLPASSDRDIFKTSTVQDTGLAQKSHVLSWLVNSYESCAKDEGDICQEHYSFAEETDRQRIFNDTAQLCLDYYKKHGSGVDSALAEAVDQLGEEVREKLHEACSTAFTADQEKLRSYREEAKKLDSVYFPPTLLGLAIRPQHTEAFLASGATDGDQPEALSTSPPTDASQVG